jgi:hypothetical protein
MVLGADGSVSGGIPAGGRNRIINGGFDVWQRGTSFSSGGIYTADRWFVAAASGQTVTVAQQSFTPGSAPVAGYEANTFARVTWSGTPTGTFWFSQKIEDVRTFAGQTVTISFWAKATSATTALSVNIEQNFGSGGSTFVNTTTPSPLSITTSWQRFSTTVAIPSISGKTIGSGSYLEIRPLFGGSSVNGNSIDIWGVQVEAGNSPTPFEVKTFAQELRECQRYYYRINNWYGIIDTSTTIGANAQFLQTMRVAPVCTKISGSTLSYRTPANDGSSTSWTFSASTPTTTAVWFQISNLSGLTAGQATHNRGAGTDIVEASAEL